MAMPEEVTRDYVLISLNNLVVVVRLVMQSIGPAWRHMSDNPRFLVGLLSSLKLLDRKLKYSVGVGTLNTYSVSALSLE